MDSDLMRWVKAQADDPNANPRFRELLAALEAAREDAERYRWLRRKVSAHGVIDGWRFAFPTHLALPAPESAMRDPAGGLDAAIDQARGKGGCEEGVKS